jgi:enoyl-CoA hydratase/carnithine racemase
MSMMEKEEPMTDLVLNETRDGIAILTLNRPEKLNALNYALIDRLLAILDDIEVDDGVRAVILTGAGERAFSAAATSASSRPVWRLASMSRCGTSSCAGSG